MLRDDAIRAGLLKPTREDIKRMKLTEEDFKVIKEARKEQKEKM